MWSGYVTVDAANSRELFFIFTESQNDPQNDPLVFWYQGGPGCSGLGGFMTENGPFTVDEGTGLIQVSTSWNQIANVVWLEQPAGVGFSYSNNPNDYNTNDTRSAHDNFAFLQGFLKLFPDFGNNQIWLTGESYGGVYIPSVAAQIMMHPSSQVFKNFRGFMAGNPVIDCQSISVTQADIQFQLFYWHGLVSQSNYLAWTAENCRHHPNSNDCQAIFNSTLTQIGVIDQQLKTRIMRATDPAFELESVEDDDNLPSLDPDDLYQDFCTDNGTLSFAIDNEECSPIGDRVQAYLNRQDVQTALGAHAPVAGNWTECTDFINYTIAGNSMIPHYELVIKTKPGSAILVYSGDIDIATVPFGRTIQCVTEIPRDSPTSEWQPWFVNRATAGYWEQYDTYTFATVKGAGHEAPTYQPITSWNLFQRFLQFQTLAPNDSEAYVKHHVPRPRARHAPRRLTEGDMLRIHKNKQQHH